MKRALVTAALALLAALPASASAADTGRLVVEGQGGTAGELVVSRATRLDPLSGVLRGGGDYAGVLVERVGSSTVAVGALQVRAFRDGTQTASAPLGGAQELAPGRYRVTLLGQGTVRAVFALQDASAPSLRARTRARVPVQFLGRADLLLDGRSRGAIAFPRSVPSGRRVVVATLMRGVRVDDLRACVTTATTCPDRLPTSVGTDGRPELLATVVPSQRGVRNVVVSVDGYRQVADRLRAVAIVLQAPSTAAIMQSCHGC